MAGLCAYARDRARLLINCNSSFDLRQEVGQEVRAFKSGTLNITMFTELNGILEIYPDVDLNGSYIGLSDSSTDGTFLVHHFLSLFLKRGHPVCFVSLSQSFNHYNTISKKLGTDLNTCKESGMFTFVDGLSALKTVVIEDEKHDDSFSSLNTENPSLSSFYCILKDICGELLGNTHQLFPVILVDDLSILINIGFPTKQVTAFVQYLSEYMQHLVTPKGLAGKGSLVTFLNNGKHNNDEDAQLLWKSICHMSTMTAEVSGLESGYCKDIHGKIMVRWHRADVKKKPHRTMQFKVMDKNISFFAAGTSKAVL